LGINEQAYMKRLLRATARGAIGQANINSVELRALSIYKPPLQLQKKFGEKWEQIRSTVSYKVSQNNNLDHLFSVLMSRAFPSELTAKWREGYMQELLAEMAQQARLLNLPLPQDPGAAP
jgi:type I restriction enzyme S subunit